MNFDIREGETIVDTTLTVVGGVDGGDGEIKLDRLRSIKFSTICLKILLRLIVNIHLFCYAMLLLAQATTTFSSTENPMH